MPMPALSLAKDKKQKTKKQFPIKSDKKDNIV